MILGLVGIVAQRLGGTTFHSWMGIGINKTMKDFKVIMNNPALLKRWLTIRFSLSVSAEKLPAASLRSSIFFLPV
jgi:hypothetical protein